MSDFIYNFNAIDVIDCRYKLEAQNCIMLNGLRGLDHFRKYVTISEISFNSVANGVYFNVGRVKRNFTNILPTTLKENRPPGNRKLSILFPFNKIEVTESILKEL